MTDHTDISGSCPYCQYKFEAATCATAESSEAPVSGDFTFCIKCANLSVFTDTLSQRKVEKEDLIKLSDEELVELQQLKMRIEKSNLIRRIWNS